MFEHPEYDRDGRVNQAAYTSDEYDFFKIMYGDKGEHRQVFGFRRWVSAIQEPIQWRPRLRLLVVVLAMLYYSMLFWVWIIGFAFVSSWLTDLLLLG